MSRKTFALLALLAIPAISFAAVGPSELAARRNRLAEALGPNALFIALSGQSYVRNGDSEFPFRQDDNLLYLTGATAPDSTLVIIPGEKEFREVLFVKSRDPQREVWTGRIASFEEVRSSSGVTSVEPVTRFLPFLHAAMSGGSWGPSPLYGYFRPPGLPRFRQAVKDGKAEVWLLLEERPSSEVDATPEMRLAAELRRRYPEIRIRDASPILISMREVKSAAELALIQRAIDITASAQKAAMHRVLEASREYEVEATIEYTFRNLGACCPGFPSIVASGRNSTTLHYDTNNDPIEREGLLLTDIGAEVDGYTADITRTYPADGSFTPEQRAIYEAVLAAQDESMPLMRKGETFASAHARAEEVIGRTLLRLGLITRNESSQVRMYFLHGLGHPIGLQVHDVLDRTRRFEPGMILTNEPGVYVRKSDVTASETYRKLTGEEQRTIAAALDRYDGIGVRIEDDILVTDGAPRLLSGGAPRTVADIEAWMSARPLK